MEEIEILIMDLKLLKIYCNGNKDSENVLDEAIHKIRDLKKLEKIEQIVSNWDLSARGNFKETFGLMYQIEQILKGSAEC